jgi:hypothetical protein
MMGYNALLWAQLSLATGHLSMDGKHPAVQKAAYEIVKANTGKFKLTDTNRHFQT